MLPLRKCRRSKSRTSSPQLRAEAFIVIALNVLAYLTAAADSSGCGGDLTEDYGVVVSPEFPQPYPADVSCLWHIAPNVTETNGTDSGLKLTFVQFHTQPADGSGGSGDVETLLVYTSDPNNATSLQPLQRYRGKMAPVPLTITSSNEIWLVFHSSSTQTSPGSDGTLGFRIIYLANGADVQCDADPLQNGRVSNDNGSFAIGSSAEFKCDWGFRMEGPIGGDCRLNGDGAEAVRPEWTQVPKCVSTCISPAPVANGSYVKSSSSLNVNATVTYSCSAPYLLSEQNPIVTCALDAKGKPHWDREDLFCAIPDCANIISLTSPSGALVNPSFPRHFVLGGTNCQWNISVQEGKVVNFNISYFDLPAQAQLTILEWKSERLIRAFQGGRGAPSQRSLTSSSGHVKVVYNGPQGNTTDQGFFISYRAVEPSEPTTLALSSSTRRFSSTTSVMTSSSDHNGPSTEKVVHAESGGDGSTSKIAVGITVPIILIVVIAVVSYRCYRKKYPVRMILGRDFGKFTNPEYRPPSTGMHSLVRQDADQFFQQQLQPTSPRVNLVFGGGIEEATVEYVNVGFQYDSQDADEEEVERRFRERKAYLFKRDEEDEVDGDQTGKWSSETYKQDEERSKKRHKVKENGRVGRDQGHDNAAYTDDSEVDSVHAEETEKTKHDEIDSESIPSDVSSSSDKPNKLNDADDKSPNKQNHTVSEIQSKASPGASSDNAYNSEMTVIEFLQMAQKGEEDQGDAENEGESYEADEMDQERSSAQIAPDRRDSGIEKMSEMTVRDFLSLVKEKRAMSDVTRVRAESLTTPYDIKKSARRRAQSAEDIWAKTSEPSQPDEKPTPENSGEMSATTPPSALEGDAEHKYEDPTTSSPRDHKESENTPIPLVEGAAEKMDTDSSSRSSSLSSGESGHSSHAHSQDHSVYSPGEVPASNITVPRTEDSSLIDGSAQSDSLLTSTDGTSDLQISEMMSTDDSATPTIGISLLSTSEITDGGEHVAGDLSAEERVPMDDTKFAEDNDHPSVDNADTPTTIHLGVPEFNFVLDRGDDSTGEDTKGSSESGQLQDYDGDVSPSSSFVVLSSSGAADVHPKDDDSDSTSVKTGTSQGSDSISFDDVEFDGGSFESFHRHEEEFEEERVLRLEASGKRPSNGSTKKAISVQQGLKPLTYSDTSSSSSSLSDIGDDVDSDKPVESNRNIDPGTLQIGMAPSVNMAVKSEDEDTETEPMEFSFTTEPRDTHFPPNPALQPGTSHFVSSAKNESAAASAVQVKSSPLQLTRPRGLAALKMHPNVRSRSSDSDGMEFSAEDIEAALEEGGEASSDEELGPQPPPMNSGKVTLQVDPKEVLVFDEENSDDDEIDV